MEHQGRRTTESSPSRVNQQNYKSMESEPSPPENPLLNLIPEKVASDVIDTREQLTVDLSTHDTTSETREKSNGYLRNNPRCIDHLFGSNSYAVKCPPSLVCGSGGEVRRGRFGFRRLALDSPLYVIWMLILTLCSITAADTTRTHHHERDIAWRTAISSQTRNQISPTNPRHNLSTQSGSYEWGPWGRLTSCTTTCGLGVRYRRRACYKVRDGGMELASRVEHCHGPERQYDTCLGQTECVEEGDLRSQQCSVYDSQPYKGRLYRWKPYKRKPGHTHSVQINSCALVCCAEGFSAQHFAVKFSSKVRDGTPCDYGPDDLNLGIEGVCINGTCARVGCDGRLHSRHILDQCNVCGGDNTSCHSVSGQVVKQVSMGYTNLVTIPRHAFRIRLVELNDTSAVFALRNDEGILFVNGRSSEKYPTIYRHVPGLVFRYYHALYSHDGNERLEGDGHSNETLYVMPGDEGEVIVSYQYSLPLFEAEGEREEDGPGPSNDLITIGSPLSYEGPPTTTPEPYFIPEHGQSARWKAMGVHQGYDMQSIEDSSRLTGSSSDVPISTTSPNTSTNMTGTDDTYPDPDVGMPGESVPANAGGKYRNPQTNSGSYRYFWKTDSTAQCSATCTSGVQTRYATCFRSDNVAVENSFCEDGQRPKPVNVRCAGRPCSPRWVASLWSSCSVSCGTGQQFRTVHCWRMMAPGFDSTVRDFLCSTLDKPYLARPCKRVDCGPLWETSEWGECSRKCGHGIQARNVRCSSSSEPCDGSTKPRTSRRCTNSPCVHKWIVSDWGECSGKCRSGMRKRSVTCRDDEGEFLHDKYCKEESRPLSVQACTTDNGSCPPKWIPQDWGVCSVDCGWGETARDVACGSVINGSFRQLPDRSCRGQRLPRKLANCREPPCKARWHFTEWSQCSKSCGEGGVRVRKVACYRDNKPSRHCDVTTKPTTSESCVHRPCQTEVETDLGQ